MRVGKYKIMMTLVAILAMASFLFCSCGNEGSDDETFSDPNIAALGELDKTEQLIVSDAYAGYLVMHLDEGLKARLEDAPAHQRTGEPALTSKTGDKDSDGILAEIESTIRSHKTAILKRSVKTAPEQLDIRRVELEKLSGKKLADFNSIYKIEIADPVEAVKTYRDLKNRNGIRNVYPYVRSTFDVPGSELKSLKYNDNTERSTRNAEQFSKSLGTQAPPSTRSGRGGHVGTEVKSTTSPTPDLTAAQGYLYSNESTGGLNAKAAWDVGVHGEGVIVVHGGSDWNFNHVDLPFRRDNLLNVPNCEYPEQRDFCPKQMDHGTGIVGILGATNNGFGITGIAHGSDIYSVNIAAGGLFGAIEWFTNGVGPTIYEEIAPGSIFTVEGIPLGFGSDGTVIDAPNDVYEIDFNAIEYATAYGLTVVEAAGNGSLNLDDPSIYNDLEVDISQNDSGAIIVGASSGAYHRKAGFSNCGTRVNAYAWGENIATTAYPYDGSPWSWLPFPGVTSPPNDDMNDFYVNNIMGTSASAPQIAGAAVLVQSYAKWMLGLPTRYLMPLKIREILVDSGVPQSDGGCNIGKQPRIDVAMNLINEYVWAMADEFPEIDTGEPMTEERMIELRQAGIGLICNSVEAGLVGNFDPSCPDTELFPPGTRIAKDLDFDGDGRADLVQWTSSGWKIDLSTRSGAPAPLRTSVDSTAEENDNYGAWDVEIEYTPINGRWVLPYVIDMNSDGRTDFVVYDKEHGRWYIRFTNSEILKAEPESLSAWEPGITGGFWDWEIDYSSQWRDQLKLNPLNCTTRTGPNCSNYSRPVPGDYNGDGWVDLAVACSDGNWRIDFGDGTREGFGGYERTIEYLSDEQLAEAPGWAYLAEAAPLYMSDDALKYMIIKVPDELPDEGKVIIYPPFDFDQNMFATIPNVFGGNENILVSGLFDTGDIFGAVTLKNDDGNWFIPQSVNTYTSMNVVVPQGGYGDNSCHPVVADFDGDDFADRAVMCPDEWRIYYSGEDSYVGQKDTIGMRYVPLEYDDGEFSLPGKSYSGGISFSYTKQLIRLYEKKHPSIPPPITVDMVVIY